MKNVGSETKMTILNNNESALVLAKLVYAGTNKPIAIVVPDKDLDKLQAISIMAKESGERLKSFVA